MDVNPARINIQAEEVAYRSAVSESTFTRVAAAINHINYYQYKHFEFGFLKGITSTGQAKYNTFTAPLVISDSEAFPTDSEIVGITVEHNTSGSSGTSTLEIDWTTQNSASWTSIFSTPISVTSAAPADAQFDTFGNATTPTGCTVPVLSKTTFLAGEKLRCRCTALQAGFPNGFLIKIYYRPI